MYITRVEKIFIIQNRTPTYKQNFSLGRGGLHRSVPPFTTFKSSSSRAFVPSNCCSVNQLHYLGGGGRTLEHIQIDVNERFAKREDGKGSEKKTVYTKG
jgi:hypothetical protein